MPFLCFLHLPRLGKLLAIWSFRPACQPFWRPRRGKQVERARLALEQLESRYTPSTIALTSSPQQIPLGSVEPGFTVKIKVNINIGQADPMELSEGEGFIKVSLQAPGFSQTIDTYGITTVPINITQKDEQLTASLILPAINDGDEGSATVEVLPTAKVQIAGPDKSDNIALYNSASDPLIAPFGAGSPMVYTQMIPVTIINQSDTMATFAVSVDPSSGGSGTLNQSSVTIAGNGQTTLTFTPNKDSAAADDVHIVAKYDNAKVGQDDMTVVSVVYATNIYNMDTPQAMRDIKAYRIPPGVDTTVPVVVTPDLSSSKEKDQVLLTVTGQNATNGAVTINGSAAPFKINNKQDVKLRGEGGDKQTAPGHAGQLQLTVQVGTQNTAHSNGFSVSAIPINFHQTAQSVQNGYKLHFEYAWDSDSGTLGDLNQVYMGEYVSYDNGGIVVGPGKPWTVPVPNPTITPSRATVKWGALGMFPFGDTHSPPGNPLPTAGPAATATGTQYYGFHDFRTDNRPDDQSHGWMVDLMGPISIVRTVVHDAPPTGPAVWLYIITKSGASAKAILG